MSLAWCGVCLNLLGVASLHDPLRSEYCVQGRAPFAVIDYDRYSDRSMPWD
jgi:hypothetical protein